MARTRTLAQLRADVCDRADIVDGSTTGRHTTANLNRRINEAVQQFMRLVTRCGSPLYLKQSAVSTATSATVDAANWAPRDYLAMPSDFYHLVGIDVTDGQNTIPMQDFMTLERNLYRDMPSWLAGTLVGRPVAYQLGGTNAAGSRVAKIIPGADAVYACTLWYLPVVADMSGDSDTFDGIAGFEEWVVNRAVMDSLIRDRETSGFQLAAAENVKLEKDMAWQFATMAGPGRKVDAYAQRRRTAFLARNGWYR